MCVVSANTPVAVNSPPITLSTCLSIRVPPRISPLTFLHNLHRRYKMQDPAFPTRTLIIARTASTPKEDLVVVKLYDRRSPAWDEVEWILLVVE